MRRGHVDSWWGWMVVMAASFNRIIIYGVSYSAGVVYVVILEVFQESSGITSMIASLITAVVFLTCPLSGYLIRRFGERKVAFIGGLIGAAGMISSAFVGSVPALIVTYGIVAGFGCGLSFMPGSVAVAKYFKNHRNLALGIASSGGGIGSFAFPPIIELLNEHYTWRGMFLILGGVTLNLCVFGLLFRPLMDETTVEQKPEESGYSSASPSENNSDNDDKDADSIVENTPLQSTEQIKDTRFLSRHPYLKIPSFYILMLNNFMYQFGASIVFGHLQAYSVFQLNMPKSNAALLYTLSGITVLIFKFLNGVLANMNSVKYFKPIYQYIFFYLLGGVATLFVPMNSVDGIYFYSLIFGMSYAACGGSLIPALLIDLAGVEAFGLLYGVVLMALAFGQLLGAPIAGILYDHQQSYDSSFIVAGTMMTLSALLMIYPLKTDLNPSSFQIVSNNDLEITIEEIGPAVDNLSTVFDPISVSVVKGSINSLNRSSIQNLNILQSTSKYSHSSHGLHHISKNFDSLESLEIRPKSSSFSVRSLPSEKQYGYRHTVSPLATECS